MTTEKLWTDFSERLRRYFRRRVEDDATADDLLQETFVKIHRGLDTVRPDADLQSWLFRIASNTVTDYYRRKKTAPPAPAEKRDELNQLVGKWLTEFRETLPAVYRDAMKPDKTQKEIAAELGLSLPGAKSRIQRGRKLLLEKLLDCCHIELDRRGNVVDWSKRKDCRSC